MAITPLLVTTQVSMQVLDQSSTTSGMVAFDSKLIKNINGNTYTQTFDDSIILPPGTTDLRIDSETINNIQMLFLMSDQSVTIKLIPQGGTIGQVLPIPLAGNNLPSFMALNNIIEVYVSNPTLNPARFTFCGAGTTT